MGPVWEDRTCQAVPDRTTFLPTCLLGSVGLRGWQEGVGGRKWVFWEFVKHVRYGIAETWYTNL